MIELIGGELTSCLCAVNGYTLFGKVGDIGYKIVRIHRLHFSSKIPSPVILY